MNNIGRKLETINCSNITLMIVKKVVNSRNSKNFRINTMRRIIFASLWVMCFLYSLLLLVYGNTGVLQYQKAYEHYKKIEQNIHTLSLVALENESKLEFWKNTLAGDLVHELGYIQHDEVALFPIVNAPVPIRAIQIERFEKNTIANTIFLQKALIGGLLTMIGIGCVMFVTRKKRHLF